MNDVELALQMKRSLRRNVAFGVLISVGLCVGAGSWAATTELTGAVFAHGKVVVDGYAKRVQHQTGGIVAEVLAVEGKSTQKGDILLRLDDTRISASLAAVSTKINQHLARQARLEAERDGLQSVPLSPLLESRLPKEHSGELRAVERRLFDARRASRLGQKELISEQQDQLLNEINGLQMQLEAKQKVIASAREELEGLTSLFNSGLTAKTRINSMERAVFDLEGQRGALVADVAKAKEKMAELDRLILQVDRDLRAEVSAELRDIVNERGELLEKERSLKDELRRSVITAPISGQIHGLTVNTIGGVITPAEILMEIVPKTAILTIEARVDTTDIDQVAVGRAATLRFTSFNANTTPELTGEVIRVSPDLETDKATGVAFYRIGLEVSQDEVARLGNQELRPGMPVEAYIKTSKRTVASYLMKPVQDHMQRVFRED